METRLRDNRHRCDSGRGGAACRTRRRSAVSDRGRQIYDALVFQIRFDSRRRGDPDAKTARALRRIVNLNANSASRSLKQRTSSGGSMRMPASARARNERVDGDGERKERQWPRSRPGTRGRRHACDDRPPGIRRRRPARSAVVRERFSHRHRHAFQNFLTDSAAVMPSISNSGRRIRRCSSTGTAIALTSSGVTKSRLASAACARLETTRACVARGPAPTRTLSCVRVRRAMSTM